MDSLRSQVALINLLIRNQCQFPAVRRPRGLGPGAGGAAQRRRAGGASAAGLGAVRSGASDGV